MPQISLIFFTIIIHHVFLKNTSADGQGRPGCSAVAIFCRSLARLDVWWGIPPTGIADLRILRRFKPDILPIWSMYIHVWYIYANIWGILMGSMLPYIAYMDPMGYESYLGICFFENDLGFTRKIKTEHKNNTYFPAGGMADSWTYKNLWVIMAIPIFPKKNINFWHLSICFFIQRGIGASQLSAWKKLSNTCGVHYHTFLRSKWRVSPEVPIPYIRPFFNKALLREYPQKIWPKTWY